VSVVAGLATARFVQLVAEHLPAKAGLLPHFDCRAWQVPSRAEAIDVFVWREADAVKNSITMAAGALYSDRELHGQHSAQKQELLFARGVNWNDYPAFFKRGTYLGRCAAELPLTEDERARIPEGHRPPPGTLVTRQRVVEFDLPPVRTIGNLADVLFERADPVART
jgi:tRNA(His) 5'-end guanylyltransferase